jgi:hypothetical protein
MFVPGCIWHVMHWLEGMDRVKVCLIGCPGSFLSMVGSAAADCPMLPNAAYCPECAGDRSFAYTTWHAVQPLPR